MECGEELVSLCVETSFVEIEQAFDRVGPRQSSVACREEWICVPDHMNDDAGGFEGIANELESGIELLHEAEVRVATRTVSREIEARQSDEIEIREVVSCSKYTADGDARWMEFFQTT